MPNFQGPVQPEQASFPDLLPGWITEPPVNNDLDKLPPVPLRNTPEQSVSDLPLKSPDRRARLSGPQTLFQGDILKPLIATSGLMFPYTPTVTFTRTASYEQYLHTHAVHAYQQFQNSTVTDIQVTGRFTANTDQEARYMLAAMRFLNASTLSQFGQQSRNRGAPPPVLRFSYMGDQMFNGVPVVVKGVALNFLDDCDYVEVKGFDTWVPVSTTITVTLSYQPNPARSLREFSVEQFRSGDLVKKGYI